MTALDCLQQPSRIPKMQGQLCTAIVRYQNNCTTVPETRRPWLQSYHEAMKASVLKLVPSVKSERSTELEAGEGNRLSLVLLQLKDRTAHRDGHSARVYTPGGPGRSGSNLKMAAVVYTTSLFAALLLPGLKSRRVLIRR